MPDDDQLSEEFALREPHPRPKAGLVEWATLLALLLVLAGMVGVFQVLGTASQDRADAEQRGYRNRAAICEIQRDLGVKLDAVCLNPSVVAYYDPKAKHTANGAAIRDMVCRLMDQLNVPQPNRDVDCVGVDQ